MNREIDRVVMWHNRAANVVRYYCFGSTAPRLRDQAIRITQKTRSRLEILSASFAALQMEAEANSATTMATMLHSTESLMKTWKAFHSADYHGAWSYLIDAQDAARAAISYSKSLLSAMEGQLQRLVAMERILFPWQAFMSPALVIEEERCSICGELLEECEHLPGKLYMGKPCRGKVVKFTAVGASLVREPADKRCYARNFPAGAGRSRNNFTGVLLPDAEKMTLKTALLLVSTFMRDFTITDEVLKRSIGGESSSPKEC